MKNIYCIYCGEKNNIEDKVCSKCHEKLDPKEHAWKDYFLDHIKDELQSKVTDKVSSIVTNYIKSHWYGIIASFAIIGVTITGIVTLVNNNSLEKVDKKPEVVILEEYLDLNSPLVQEIYALNKLANIIYFDTNFYENHKVTYDDLSEENRFMMAYYKDLDLEEESKMLKTAKSCEELKDYGSIYSSCLKDSEWVLSWSYALLDKDELLNKYQSIFGKDKIFTFQTYHLMASEAFYDSTINNYIYRTLPEGYFIGFEEIMEPIKAIKSGSSIIIYDRYMVYENGALYKDRNRTIKLSDDDVLKEGSIHKHVFRKNLDDKYYWVSSEEVENANL